MRWHRSSSCRRCPTIASHESAAIYLLPAALRHYLIAFPDIKVQEVTAFPDVKVEKVNAFPDKCGKWQIVTAFPDTKVQIVTSFPDVKVQYVTSFPGLR